MGTKNLTGLKHFRSFRFSFASDDKIQYELSLADSSSLIHGVHRLMNLSLSGFAFESDQILDPEKQICLKIKLSKNDYLFTGRLVRGTRHRERKNCFVYGVHFSHTKMINESELIKDLVFHFKHKRLRKELTRLLVDQVRLDDPEPNDLMSVIIGLFSDFRSFDERGDFLETFMLQTEKIFRCEGVHFFELQDNGESIQSVFPFQIAGKRQFQIKGSIFQDVIRTKKPLVFRPPLDFMKDDPFFSCIPRLEGVALRNGLLSPILDRGQNCVGVLKLFNFHRPLTQERQLKYIQSVKIVCLILSTFYDRFKEVDRNSDSVLHHRSSIKVDRNERKLILIGESDSMRSMRAFVQRYKNLAGPILITGETGTGKELLARILHKEGDNHKMSLGVIDVSEWKDGLSLKDHFLGTDQKVGKFELYSGGTLVLKNIELLTKKQQEEFISLYDDKYSIRLIVTSQFPHQELKAKLTSDMKELLLWWDEGQIELPALRDRGADLHLLVDFFLRMECQANGFIHKNLSYEVGKVFESYEWPGNIRELELVLKRCVWAYQGAHIIQKIPETVVPLFDNYQGQYKSYKNVLDEFPKPLTQKEQEYVFMRFRTELVDKTLKDCGGDAQKARRVLNLTASQWYEWVDDDSQRDESIKKAV